MSVSNEGDLPHLGPIEIPRSLSAHRNGATWHEQQQQALNTTLLFYLVSQTNKAQTTKEERNVNEHAAFLCVVPHLIF